MTRSNGDPVHFSVTTLNSVGVTRADKRFKGCPSSMSWAILSRFEFYVNFGGSSRARRASITNTGLRKFRHECY